MCKAPNNKCGDCPFYMDDCDGEVEDRKHGGNAFAETTICWNCSKSCGGCSWADRFEPVEGWKAKAFRFEPNSKGGLAGTISYTVYYCPEFQSDLRHRYTHLDDEGVTALATKVVSLAGREYRNAIEDLKELRTVPRSQKTIDTVKDRKIRINLIENFFRDGNIFAEIIGLDGDDLLEKLEVFG